MVPAEFHLPHPPPCQSTAPVRKACVTIQAVRKPLFETITKEIENYLQYQRYVVSTVLQRDFFPHLLTKRLTGKIHLACFARSHSIEGHFRYCNCVKMLIVLFPKYSEVKELKQLCFTFCCLSIT